MKSIFKALDGDHLDRALFRSKVSEEEETRHDEVEPKNVSGRNRLGRRIARRADSRPASGRTSHPDSGL